MARRIAAACLLVVLAGLAGCGTKKVSISGAVTRGGEKLTWPDGGYLLVLFTPEDWGRDSTTYRATKTDLEASTYEVEAIPPGRYKVAVQHFDLKFNDALGKAHDAYRTTLVYEVPAEGGTVNIDLPASGAGTRSGGGPPGGGRKGGGKKGGPSPAEPGKAEPAPPDDKKADPPQSDDKKD
jgi:hypothetical protein